MFPQAKKELLTSASPDHKYVIDFYTVDAGAMGSIGVTGELRGPLWFKRNIYSETHADEVHVKWKNNSTVIVNNHELNLKDYIRLSMK